MVTSVELQEPMSYYLFWLILAIVAVAAVFFIQIFFRVILREQLKRHREKKQPKVKPPKKKPLPVLKWEYMQRLAYLERGILGGAYSKRAAYQELSMLIRSFVNDATGIKVQNFSLQEIRRVGIPGLTALVQEYYEPEFAYYSEADAKSAIEKGKELITKWS